MNCEQVTRRQARTIRARVAEMRMYFYRLRTRMTHRGFHPDDQLFALVQTAEQAIDELYVDLDTRVHEGPVSLPQPKKTSWLEQRSARKQHDRR